MRLLTYVAEISLQLLIYILVKVDLLVNVYWHFGSASSFFKVFLIAGTLIIYHWAMRPIKTEYWKLHYRYYTRQEKKTLKIYIEILIIRSSHRNSNREGKKSVFHHFCPGLPVSLTLCHTKTKLNSVALVRERTIPTERPPPVGEVSANFCG